MIAISPSCGWSSGTALALLLLLTAEVGASSPNGERRLPEMRPFMEGFLSDHRTAIATREVDWWSAWGQRKGFFAHPENGTPVPAVVLVGVKNGGGETSSDRFLRQTARDLAGIGFAALVAEANAAVPMDGRASEGSPSESVMKTKQTSAELAAAVHWLRSQPEVSPDRVGVAGWGAGGIWALEMAAVQGLSVCVVGDGDLPLDPSPALLGGLSHTAVLFVRGAAERSLLDDERFARFQSALSEQGLDCRVIGFDQATPGFMDPGHGDVYHAEQADRAWFEIYEFLGRHLEDLPQFTSLTGAAVGATADGEHFATIADLMKAVNAPEGVRGQLLKSMENPPETDKEWRLFQARAAVIAEGAQLLKSRRPETGSPARWRSHLRDFETSVRALRKAASSRDLAASRLALDRMKENCGQCHLDHR